LVGWLVTKVTYRMNQEKKSEKSEYSHTTRKKKGGRGVVKAEEKLPFLKIYAKGAEANKKTSRKDQKIIKRKISVQDS
jgi:hypothetical protein